jgi:hypothetical protein
MNKCVAFSLFALLVASSAAGCRPATGRAGSSLVTDSVPSGYPRGIGPSTLDDFRQVVQDRELAIQSATAILEAHANGQPIDEHLVSQSAELLRQLRAEAGIEALIDNLEFTPSVSVVGAPEPLECLECAQALRTIGSRRVIAELIVSLRRKRTEKELLITAHLLASLDTPEVAGYRLSVTIAAERERADADPDFVRRLEAVKDLLQQPDFLRSLKSWPCNMRSTRKRS